MMNTRWEILLCCWLFCVPIYAQDLPVANPIITSKITFPDNIDHIKIDGPFVVTITDDLSSPQLIVTGPANIVGKFCHKIENNTLHLLTSESLKDVPVNDLQIKIKLAQLDMLTYSDGASIILKKLNAAPIAINAYGGNLEVRGQVNLRQLNTSGIEDIHITNINTNALDIAAYGSGTIDLNGKIYLQNVAIGGNEIVNVSQVESSEVGIQTFGNSELHLYGHAQLLNAQASGQSLLDLFNFPASQIYVRTSGMSQAKVVPGQVLIAHALDSSDIYYYQQPVLLVPQMSRAGSILPMFANAPAYPIYWENADEYSPSTNRSAFNNNFFVGHLREQKD